METENPIIAESIQMLVPVASEVRLEVSGESIIEPKRPSEDAKTFCEKLEFWMEISFIIILGLAFFAGFISLFVWMADPTLFGTPI
jgi:hypothetical protein